MRLVDANLLVYAHVSSFPQHTVARRWLDERLSAPEPLGLPWPSLLAFMRLVSNPRVFARPEPVDAAWRQVRAWLACGCVWIPLPTERHAETLDRFLSRHDLRANHVPDAHLAALAVEHGLILCTSDIGFARYEGLRRENPIGRVLKSPLSESETPIRSPRHGRTCNPQDHDTNGTDLLTSPA